MDEDSDCVDIQGGGCAAVPPGRPRCEDVGGNGGSGDLDSDTWDSGLVLEGGGCGSGADSGGCSTVPGPVGAAFPLLMALLFTIARRWPLLAVFLALPAAAVDVQSVQRLDGGPWFSLDNPEVGENGTLRFASTSSVARNPVMQRSGNERTPRIPWLVTQELGASIAILGVRAGLAQPVHRTVDGVGLGDTTVWAHYQLPLSAGMGVFALRMAIDIPQRTRLPLLSHQAVRLGGSGSIPIKGWLFGYDVGMRVQGTTLLPGLSWGLRADGGVGMRRQMGPLEVSAEVIAGIPLRDVSVLPGQWPIEAIGGVGYFFRDSVRVGLSGGVGLTRGVGAPAFRALAIVDLIGRKQRDRDGDTLLFPRDLCPLAAEDFDGFRDRNGCPDLDNDRDGIVDADDACPNHPETVNGYQDEDGCPDAQTRVSLTVLAARGAHPEVAAVTLGEHSRSVLHGEAFVLDILPGSHTLSVNADGFRPYTTALSIPERDEVWPLVVRLGPIERGTLTVLATSNDGEPLHASVAQGEETWTVSPQPVPHVLHAGSTDIRVAAPGHKPRTLAVEIPVDADTTVQVELERLALWVDNGTVRMNQTLRFPLDGGAPEADSLLAVDSIAEWLRSNPGIRLIRVEGHADALGASDYNYALSLRRAEWVRAALIDRGISPERLLAIAAGESRAGVDPERQVSFLVLVWDDEAPMPSQPSVDDAP